MRFDVDRMGWMRVRRVSAVCRLARLVASLRMHVRMRAQLLPMLSVRALLILEVTKPLIVPLYLIAKGCVFNRSALFIQFQATDSVQTLQVDPAPPSDAHAVHDESRHNVGLMTNG